MSFLMLGGPGMAGAKGAEKFGESEAKFLATKRKNWALTGKTGKAIGEGFKQKDEILQRVVGSVCKARK
jgi:hypothetical protein